MPAKVKKQKRDSEIAWLKSRLLDVKSIKFDMAIFFKTVHLPQSILLDVHANHKVHYSPDDASNVANITADYLLHEHEWDCIVTTKHHNVSELQARGAQRAEFVWSAYDPQIHARNVSVTGAEAQNLGFIGAWRPDRHWLPDMFASVAPSRGIIYGPRWRRKRPIGPRGVKMRPATGGADFLAASVGFTATPILLNSDNRDTHTCRSFEAPAAGNLCIVQRTTEHEELFDEGREAVFFNGPEELIDRLRDVISWPREKVGIMAARGQKRVTTGGHTYTDRAVQILALNA